MFKNWLIFLIIVIICTTEGKQFVLILLNSLIIISQLFLMKFKKKFSPSNLRLKLNFFDDCDRYY